MNTEKRTHPRFQPQGLVANIIIDPASSDEEIVMEGEVVDMSYNGIKIRLRKPLSADVDHSSIRIEIMMPQSGIPVSIHGIIKHIKQQCEYGLQFAENCVEQNVDGLMFECIKLAKNSGQIQGEQPLSTQLKSAEL